MKGINEVKLPQISDFPDEFHNFYLKNYQKKKNLPTNCSFVCLYIPDEFVDGKKTIFKEYKKKEGQKIPDEIHFSKNGLGFLENKKGEFPMKDLDKFRNFKFYFDKNYRNKFKTCDLNYCVIRCKKLNDYMRKTFNTKGGVLKYKNNEDRSIIGKNLKNEDILVYMV